MSWLSAGCALLLLSAAGCGGEVEGGGSDQGTGGESANGNSGTDTSTSTSTGTGTGTGNTKLPQCVLGFEPALEPGRPCAWLADELCYGTKTAACACVCPRNRNNSLCISDFDNGPDGKVEVFCN